MASAGLAGMVSSYFAKAEELDHYYHSEVGHEQLIYMIIMQSRTFGLHLSKKWRGEKTPKTTVVGSDAKRMMN